MNKLIYLCLTLCLSLSLYAQRGTSVVTQPSDTTTLIRVDRDELERALRQIHLSRTTTTQLSQGQSQVNTLRLMLLLHLLQSRAMATPQQVVLPLNQGAKSPTQVSVEVGDMHDGHQAGSNSLTLIKSGKDANKTPQQPIVKHIVDTVVRVLNPQVAVMQWQGATTQTTDTLRIVEHRVDTVATTDVADFKRSVYFTVGSAVLDSYASKTLIEVLDFLRQYPNVRVRIVGYASADGNAKQNKALAERRTQSVVSFIKSAGLSNQIETARGGIDTAVSGYQLARRVDILLMD